MKLKLAAVLACAISLASSVASAGLLKFELTDGAYNVQFIVDRNPTPDYFDGGSFRLDSVPVSVDKGAATAQSIWFWADNSMGGLTIENVIDQMGPVLFTGPTNKPQFLLGKFDLDHYTYAYCGPTAQIAESPFTLTVTEAPAPAPIALLVAGLLCVTALRRRASRDAVGAVHLSSIHG